MIDYSVGCRMSPEKWAYLNRAEVFDNPALRQYVSPFFSGRCSFASKEVKDTIF
jgi:hypothetical protein